MKYFVFFLLFLGTTNLYSFQVIDFKINPYATYYTEFINVNDITNDSLFIQLHSTKNLEIEKALSKNSDLEISPSFLDKKRKEIKFTVIKKPNSNFKKRENFIFQDFKGREFFLTIGFYTKAINIDQIKKDFEFSYTKSDYPVFLYSNNPLVGNFSIVNANLEIEYEFQLLSSFGWYLDTLKNGEYFISENDVSNKLFSFKVEN